MASLILYTQIKLTIPEYKLLDKQSEVPEDDDEMATATLEKESGSAYVRNQILITLHLAPTNNYPRMAIGKLLGASAEKDYVLIQDAEEAGSLLASFGNGRLKGLNALFISPLERVTRAVEEMMVGGGMEGMVGWGVIGPGTVEKWGWPAWPAMEGQSPWQPDKIIGKMRLYVGQVTIGHVAIE